jgi:hypothetical protein
MRQFTHKAGSKVEARWKQDGSKMEAKVEHGRRNDSAPEALRPSDGKPGGLLPLGGKSQRLLLQIVEQPQDKIGTMIMAGE